MAELSAAETGLAEASAAETGLAEASAAEAAVAETEGAGANAAEAAEASAARASTAGATAAKPAPAEASKAGTGTANPGTAPATRPGTAPATRPGTAPATRPGTAPATRPAAGAPARRPGALARRPGAEPSWGMVLATTFRLWAKRRLEKSWVRALLVLVLAGIVFLAGAVTVTLTQGKTTSNSATGQGTIPAGSGALAAVASARKQAATWVAQQVNPDEVIGCDPMMCAALEAANIQASRLLVLGPSQPDPLGSEILLDTATLRSQFGGRLETVFAPVSLAAFGSGVARVEVRSAAPDGAPAYLAELARDVAARKAAGTEMLRNASIHASPAARRQLLAGQVDTRLLVTLVTLSHSYPVDIISFGANQAGASPGVPLRSAEIAGAPGPGSTPAVSAPTLRSFVSAQQPPYRPSIVSMTNASRRTVLRVGYPAPSLLGLLGTHG